MSGKEAGGQGGAKSKRQHKRRSQTASKGEETKLRAAISIEEHPVVIFDLETTGLGETDEIIQLAAVAVLATGAKQTFDTFILPDQPIPPRITQLTGISGDLEHRKMFYQGEEVEFNSMEVAMQQFLEWLRANFGGQTVYLGAHNCQHFDSKFLIRALDCCSEDMNAKFERKVAGFVDTLFIFREIYPGLPSYKQPDLVRRYLGVEYRAHNAVDDVAALMKLVEFSQVEPSVLKECSFTVKSVREDFLFM